MENKEAKLATQRYAELDDIDSERERQDVLEARVLTAAGWKHTSGTPGCYWMWEREIEWDCWSDTPPGQKEPVKKTRFFCVSQETAVRMQRHIDARHIPDND